MSKGLFNLEGFENLNENDILHMSINENSEFAHKNPDTNHPEVPFETGGASGKQTSVSVPGGDSETPKAKPYDASSVSIPGGDSETPKAKPYDASSVPGTGKVTLTSDVYNNALASLKKSFKEGYEIMEMLEKVDVVQQSIDQKQEEFTENAIAEAIFESYADGPYFEAVNKQYKAEVKGIVKNIRKQILGGKKKSSYKGEKLSLFHPSIIASRNKELQLLAWQIVCILRPNKGVTIGKVLSDLNEDFKDVLGVYKLKLLKMTFTIGSKASKITEDEKKHTSLEPNGKFYILIVDEADAESKNSINLKIDESMIKQMNMVIEPNKSYNEFVEYLENCSNDDNCEDDTDSKNDKKEDKKDDKEEKEEKDD